MLFVCVYCVYCVLAGTVRPEDARVHSFINYIYLYIYISINLAGIFVLRTALV